MLGCAAYPIVTCNVNCEPWSLSRTGRVPTLCAMQLSHADILNVLPHRPPMLMIDSVVSLVPQMEATACKNISGNEPCLQGHFPGRPIFPGVLILEALAQTAAVLAAYSQEDGSGRRLPYLVGIDEARFRRPVHPGDQLELKVTRIRAWGVFWQLRGAAFVRGELASEAMVMATLVDEAMATHVASVPARMNGAGVAPAP